MTCPPLRPETVVIRSGEAVFAELQGEAVVMLPQDRRYFGLDEVAATVWGLMGEPVELGRLQRHIVARYEVDAERSWSDLIGLVEAMIRHGLVEVVGNCPGAGTASSA